MVVVLVAAMCRQARLQGLMSISFWRPDHPQWNLSRETASRLQHHEEVISVNGDRELGHDLYLPLYEEPGMDSHAQPEGPMTVELSGPVIEELGTSPSLSSMTGRCRSPPPWTCSPPSRPA